MTTKLIAALFSVYAFQSLGQFEGFSYSRSLDGVKDEWHRVELPNEIFSKVSSNFTDLRFFGVNKKKDTIEAPYLINYRKTVVTTEKKDYEVISVKEVGNEYHYTFYFKDAQQINEMNLDFSGENYDWKVAVDGSNDQINWDRLVGDYRLIRVSNQYSDYAYKDINLPDVAYHYYRLRIPAAAKPVMILPSMYRKSVNEGKVVDYHVKSMKVINSKSDKETLIEIELNEPVPVCLIKVRIGNNYDYYRNMSIEYLYDSIKTEKGYIMNYMNVGNEVLSSLETNDFEFQNTVASRFRLVIRNYDNQPLDVKDVQLGGYAYEAVVRFTEPADYFMAYGNKEVSAPQYDLLHFRENIPADAAYLELGKEIIFDLSGKEESKPFFSSKWWLYALMGLVIIVLGSFTIKMMRSDQNG